MSERKRDTSKKRESILDAAIQAFQDHGYDNTSMDRIAEVAGASKRTVYNHFASKEALFRAVLDRFMATLSVKKQIAYDSGRALEEQLSEFAEVKLMLVSDPVWFGLMKVLLAVLIREPQLAEEVITRAEESDTTLVDWLKAARDDGRLVVPEPELAARVFWSMISGALVWPQLLYCTMSADDVLTVKAEMIQTFLARYGA